MQKRRKENRQEDEKVSTKDSRSASITTVHVVHDGSIMPWAMWSSDDWISIQKSHASKSQCVDDKQKAENQASSGVTGFIMAAIG